MPKLVKSFELLVMSNHKKSVDYELRTHNHFGFTLIELLVVIAIISILATISFVAYSGVQKNARDSKRQSEINSIAQALEIRYQISSGVTCDGETGPSNGGTYCQLRNSWFADNVVPTDPSATTTPYCIWHNTAVTTPTLSSVTPAVWSTGTCPDIASPVGTVKNPVAQGAPAINAAFFKVCAMLEKTGQPYCVNSKQ